MTYVAIAAVLVDVSAEVVDSIHGIMGAVWA